MTDWWSQTGCKQPQEVPSFSLSLSLSRSLFLSVSLSLSAGRPPICAFNPHLLATPSYLPPLFYHHCPASQTAFFPPHTLLLFCSRLPLSLPLSLPPRALSLSLPFFPFLLFMKTSLQVPPCLNLIKFLVCFSLSIIPNPDSLYFHPSLSVNQRRL